MRGSRRLFVLGLAATAAPAAVAAASRVHVVVIDKMAFGPAPAGLRVGDTIEWVNRDIFRHTATARDGRFDIDLPPNGRGRTLMRAAGQVAVYCRYHAGMTAVLAVRK